MYLQKNEIIACTPYTFITAFLGKLLNTMYINICFYTHLCRYLYIPSSVISQSADKNSTDRLGSLEWKESRNSLKNPPERTANKSRHSG